jgi:hypothetical protein
VIGRCPSAQLELHFGRSLNHALVSSGKIKGGVRESGAFTLAAATRHKAEQAQPGQEHGIGFRFRNIGDEPWHVGQYDSVAERLNRACIAVREEFLISLNLSSCHFQRLSQVDPGYALGKRWGRE